VSFHDLALFLPRQTVEYWSQLPTRLPEYCLAALLGHEHHMMLSLTRQDVIGCSFWDARTRKELPSEAPPSPHGMERNVVITQWDWTDPKAYLHDEIASDKRKPNACVPL